MTMWRVALIPLTVLALAAQAPSPSAAEKALAGAQEQVRKDPTQIDSHNNLAKALVRRARETGDPAFYAQAERAVEAALRIDPDNFEALKARVTILLGRREYRPALELAQKLNKRIPDDVVVYGLVADACMALGDYKQAETSAQWMLDLRRGNVPGMIRGAQLRSAFGEVDGAIEWFTSAYKLTSAGDTGERAWLLTEIARLRLDTGKLELAEEISNRALSTFTDYYLALEVLAEVKAAQGKDADAVDLLRRLHRQRPRPEYLFSLGAALKHAGSAAESARAFADFESQAVAMLEKPDNANRQLIFYYADHAGKPADALRIARLEIAKRQDIATLDAYAWALHANGEYAQARAQLDKALAVGTRDAGLERHSAAIAK